MLAFLRLTILPSRSPPLCTAPKACSIKSSRICAAAMDMSKNKSNETDKPEATAPPPRSKLGDAMLSFGEGYATRSEEEGFGGIYGGNTTLHDDDQMHHTRIEYDDEDDKQGSEVKEKERARNQTHAASHHHPS
ncbi:unnamed protein product [Cuscuta epithymum]|uniref:Uncharacterized protein n=1 Tax=Cuscuta epithymum TaxID=186058 RepID=A0AAV0D7B9_9ASTE|nr:unnamed protein product [Cuscuta epithymum]